MLAPPCSGLVSLTPGKASAGFGLAPGVSPLSMTSLRPARDSPPVGTQWRHLIGCRGFKKREVSPRPDNLVNPGGKGDYMGNK